MSFQKKMTSGETEEGTFVEPRPSKKKREHLKKRLSSLTFFCAPLKGKSSQPGIEIAEEKKKYLPRDHFKEVKTEREEMCSLKQPPSRKMCPKCEIVICRKCNTLHADSRFVAHCLLDHYDRGGSVISRMALPRRK